MTKKTESTFIADFKKGIKLLALVEGHSYEYISTKAGISKGYMTRFLQNSQNYNPTLDTLIAIANVFGMTIEEVIYFARTVKEAVDYKRNDNRERSK